MRHVQIIVCFLSWGIDKSYDCRKCIFCSIACFLLFFAAQIMAKSLFISEHSADHWVVWVGSSHQKGHIQIHRNKGIFLYFVNIDWHL